jgi:fatty-acyl-CoA synthase
MNALRSARAAVTVTRANSKLGERPDRLLRAMLGMRPYGLSALGAIAAAVARTPHRVAVLDDEESVTYRELWDRANALAVRLAASGVADGARIGLLAGNSAEFVEDLVAAQLLGATTVLLNTRFAPLQLARVAKSERLDVLIADRDNADLAHMAKGLRVFCGDERDRLNAADAVPLAPRGPARIVLLTSGTTGPAKGAVRPSGGELEASAAVLGRIPLRHGDTRLIAAPLFHGWGLTHLLLALGMSATVVLRRNFDPEDTLRAIERQRVRVAALVPVMVQRILALPPALLASVDTSTLRVIACSGSPLPPRLATETLRRFGPVLYNVYGSTEVAVATIATPGDLAARPDTAGRPAPGAVVRILGQDNEAAPPGAVGRIFVRNAMQFHGYTGGGGKLVVDGLMASGDLGSFDRKGRLVVAGREDDMIISGGENVYPRVAEEALAGHPDIADVTVLGGPDAEFGQALTAWVVRRRGSTLDEESVRRYAHEHLARFEVPRSVVFVDQLPRNAMGKVVRMELAAR